MEAGGGEHRSGEWTAVLELDRAAYAEWLLGLEQTGQGHEHDRRGLRWAVEVHTRSSLRFGASLRQEDILPGSAMHLVAHLAEYDVPVDADRVTVRAELTGPGGSDVIELAPAGDGVFEADHVATLDGLYRFRVVAEGRTVHGERFTREQLVTGAIYVPGRPDDPRPPTGGGTECRDRVATLVTVLRRDRRLARALDAALTEHGTSLVEVLECLRVAAGGQRPSRPDVVRPPAGPALQPRPGEGVPVTASALAALVDQE